MEILLCIFFLLLSAGFPLVVIGENKQSTSFTVAGFIMAAVALLGFISIACYLDNEETKNDHSCIIETEYNYCPNCGCELKGEIE